MPDSGLGFRVAYDGSRYAGFQLQAKSDTLQRQIERALSIFFRKTIGIRFSSRTDAGVHAYDQWISIPKGWKLYQSLSKLDQARCLHSLNALLPSDIRFWQLLKLSPKYSPKTSFLWKEYEYCIAVGPTVDPLISSRVWWIRSPLDPKKIKEGLRIFKGKHDFSAFMKSSKSFKGSTIREIFKADLNVERSKGVDSLHLLRFRIRGSGFLHHMIRNMMGTLVELGRGGDLNLKKTLESKDRKQAGVNAPPGALCLMRAKVKSENYEIIWPR